MYSLLFSTLGVESISSISMHKFASILRKIRPLMAGFVALLAVIAVIIPATATPTPWHWQDQSDLLPVRDGGALSIVSEREGVWLLSDGTHLYRYDGATIVDLTKTARDHEIYSIARIFSDGRNWLIDTRPQSAPSPVFWLTDGYSWTNVTKSLPSLRGDFDAVGVNGDWFIRAYSPATTYDPAHWTLVHWNGTTDAATPVSVPMEIDTRAAGCFKNAVEATYCQGTNAIFTLNGQWYLAGGKTESRNLQGTVIQEPKTSLWRWQNNTWVKMSDLPSFRYVSGIWAGKKSALIATSNTTNPFASDKFWQFDGNTLEEMSDQALAAGLLSIDAREIRAASNGRSWMLLIGKRLVRFDGALMTTQGQTRDFFTAISGSTSNVFVLGGAVSDANSSFMTTPITAKLVRVEEVEAKQEVQAPLTEVFSKVRGPRLTVRAIPQEASIGDGQTFTLRVEATDPDGVAQTHIYVNGARLKSCNSSVCELTQTFWTNGQAVRSIPLYGSAMDKQGFVNHSPTITLRVDRNIKNSNDTTRLNRGVSLPENTKWTMDTLTQTSWTAWRTSSETALSADKTTTYTVAAQNPSGLGRIEVYTNGDLKRTCDFTSSLDIRLCSITIAGQDYPANAEIFANARVFTSQNADNQASWVTGMRIPRDSTITGTVKNTGNTPANQAIKQLAVTLTPNTGSVKRGDRVVAHVAAQNSADGITRIEVYANNDLKRVCLPGGALTPVNCDLEIDTGIYPAGTGLNVYARVRDNAFQLSWSNTAAAWIGDTRIQNTPDASQNKVSVWSWMSPIVTELGAGQHLNYSVGAWSGENIQRIDMIVDGVVRKTCSYGNTSGNKECTLTLADTDFADRHTAIFNARVVDQAGNKGWSDVRNVKVVRDWLPTPESMPATITIESDHTQGYKTGDRVSFVARSWSANSVERTEILADGRVVASCPGDVCRWTSAALTGNQLEYQARAIDTVGRSVWTGVLGVSQQ